MKDCRKKFLHSIIKLPFEYGKVFINQIAFQLGIRIVANSVCLFASTNFLIVQQSRRNVASHILMRGACRPAHGPTEAATIAYQSKSWPSGPILPIAARRTPSRSARASGGPGPPEQRNLSVVLIANGRSPFAHPRNMTHPLSRLYHVPGVI